MATSTQLMEQAQELIEQAKAIRRTELDEIILQVKETIRVNEISAEDLGYLPGRKKRVKKDETKLDKTIPDVASTTGNTVEPT